MCLGILPGAADPLRPPQRRATPRSTVRGARARQGEPSCRCRQIFRADLLKTTIAASLLATGIQGGYYAMFTWIPTYLKNEREPDRRRHERATCSSSSPARSSAT